MKKLLLIVSAAALTFVVACKKKTDDPAPAEPAKQNSLLVYNTATWCGPCGAYGSPTYKAILDEPGMVAIDLHTSGSSYLVPYYKKPSNDTLFVSPFAFQLYNQTMPNGYIPHFYMNNSFLGNSSVTSSQIKTANDNFTKNAPKATIQVSAKANGSDVINIDYTTKFIDALSGDYHISLLVVEKAIDGYQASAPGNFTTHKHIVRASALTGTLANQTAFSASAIASNPAAGTTKTGTATFTFETYSNIPAQIIKWNYTPAANEIVAILWKKSGTSYEFVNASKADIK